MKESNISEEKESKNLQQINQNNKKFKEFYDLEVRNALAGNDESEAAQYEDSSKTSFYFQKYLFLRNFEATVILSLIFVGYFAYRFEFDQ